MSALAQEYAPDTLGCASSAALVYHAIRSCDTEASRADPFLAHALACSLAIGIEEARLKVSSVGEATGLDGAALRAIVASWMPAAAEFITFEAEPWRILRDDEEEQLRELLVRSRDGDSVETQWIVSIVTRRAMRPNHLWQDLGLRDRGELSALIERFFPSLAAANTDNMKWKKFFFRQICELEGFSLCAVPTCAECADLDACFGDETGESSLARIANS